MVNSMFFDIHSIVFNSDRERDAFNHRMTIIDKEISTRLTLADALDLPIENKVLIFLDRIHRDAKYLKRFGLDPLTIYKYYVQHEHSVLERIFPTKFYNYMARLISAEFQYAPDYAWKLGIFDDFEVQYKEDFKFTAYYPIVVEEFINLKKGFLK